MATTQLKLSTKTDAAGKSQIIVKLTISRSNRPCFKSGVSIRPEWFKPVRETKKGLVYGIAVPKKGRLNASEVRDAESAKNQLDTYITKLVAVTSALSGNEDLNHDTIHEAVTLAKNLQPENITYQALLDKRKEAEDSEGGNDRTFFEWFDLFIQKREISPGRKRCIRVLVRVLARYETFIRLTDKHRKDFTLDINTIDKETLEDFFDYMANEKQLSEDYGTIFEKILEKYPVEFTPKHHSCAIMERGRNLLVTRKRILKAFFNWLIENKYTTNRPFDGITIGTEKYGTPFYLTLDERNKVAGWDFSGKEKLGQQRDIFVFQCLIGCRVSDLVKLTPDNLISAGEVLCVEYIAQKTKGEKPVSVRVPLNGRAKALVAKYNGADPKGRLFPFISADKYNDAIKKILKECGIKRMVSVINPTTGETEQRPICDMASSHMARRTFIGNLYKKVKDPNLIGKMSGHAEGSKAFARYRDIDIDTMKETVSLID